MRISRAARRVAIAGGGAALHRDPEGVMVIEASSELDLTRGLGFAHGLDRALQMLLVRLIGQGRLSELKATEEALAIDVFMRQMGFAADAEVEAEACGGETRELVEAYRDGVHAALAANGIPFELRLVGHTPEPWRAADTFLTIKLMSYVGLAQTQQNAEKLIIEAVKAGTDLAKLRALFSPHLDGFTPFLAELVSRARLGMGLVTAGLEPSMPTMKASNNWAVAASRSASGGALQCNDPHLEVNRLPGVWYEVIGRIPDDYRLGVTVPGVPGVVMGRTRRISAGLTYGFMDMIDYFLEDVRGGSYKRGDTFLPFRERRETIVRKGKTPITFSVLYNHTGTLETAVNEPLRDGIYLNRAFSARRAGPETLASLFALWRARDVPSAQEALTGCALSANWAIADRDGNVGYQQTGLLPVRAHSGLHPVPAWDQACAWRGFVEGERLARVTNPPEGFVASANDTWNPEGGPLAVNLSMGDSRAARVRELLAGRSGLTKDDMKRIQRDLFSRQAERIRAVALPHLPDTPAAALLAAWDCRYDAASKGAVLFERLYAALLSDVFGKRTFGERLWKRVVTTTSFVNESFDVLDRVLVEGDEALWFGLEGRGRVFARVAGDVLLVDPETVPRWGEINTITMTNIFFGGALPRILGVDHGPVAIEGGRGTIVQGQVFQAGGRKTSFAPSWRYVTDLSTDEADTALAGGPSDRRFSRHYTSDVARWLAYGYKTVRSDA